MNTKTKAILALGSLFVIGFLSGFIFSNAISASGSEYTMNRSGQADSRSFWQRNNDRDGGNRGERMRAHLAGLLDLTTEQQDPFFEQMGEYRSTIRSEIRQARNNEHRMIIRHYETMRNEVSDILSAEQLQKMDEHLHPDSVMEQRRRSSGHERFR